MADTGQALIGIGTGLMQASQTLANAQRLRQEEQIYATRLQELTAQRDERLYQQAVSRVQTGLNLPDKNKDDYFLRGPGRQYIETVLGGKATDDVIKVFTTNKLRDKTEQILTYLPEVMKDPSQMQAIIPKIRTALADPALAYDAINTLSDVIAKQQASQKTQAEIKKLESEAQSPFGDPKFAYKQGFDQAKAVKDQAETSLAEYRKQLGLRQQASRNDPRIGDPGFQAEIKRQALEAAGINEAQLAEYDRVSRATFPQLIEQYMGQGTVQGGSQQQQPVAPADAQEEPNKFGVLPIEGERQPSAADIKALSEAESIPAQLEALKLELKDYKDLFGPVKGRGKALNPYNTRAQVFQSRIKELAQTYGKFKEGGVLRKEDVPKYEAIFPNLSDTYDSAVGKLENVLKSLDAQLEMNKQLLESGGYRVPQPKTQPQSAPGSGISPAVQKALDMVK